MKSNQSGYSLIELVIALFVFSIVGGAFFQLMLGARSASLNARDVIAVSEEARLAFNRLVRDAREANAVKTATATSFQIWTDFDNDNVEDAAPSDPTGSHEVITYSWNSIQLTISITSGSATEVLLDGVDCVRNAANQCVTPVFTFSSNRLEFDANGDGVTSATELDAQTGVGNGDYASNPFPNGTELNFVDNVLFSLAVSEGEGNATMYAEAQLRNRR